MMKERKSLGSIFLNGVITENGTHEELISTGGVYASLYHTQRDF